MAATPLSCFRWRPRPFRSRQLPPAIVVELKLHRSTLLWRLRAADFVAAEGAAEWEARWCTLLTHSRGKKNRECENARIMNTFRCMQHMRMRTRVESCAHAGPRAQWTSARNRDATKAP